MTFKPFGRPSKLEAKELVSRLVARYENQRDDLQSPQGDLTETETRSQYIDPLLMALGWDVHNESGKKRSQLEVVMERSENLSSSGVRGRPDYKLMLDGDPVVPIEAKRVTVGITENQSAAIQARSYGFSLSLPVAVLTNFENLIVFDATVEPQECDDARVARLPGGVFSYKDFVSRFEELWTYLSFESLYGAGIAEVYGYELPPRGESPFDRAFLADVRNWRVSIANNVAASNPDLGVGEVSLRSQKILNALIFLRVCEDRNLRKYEALKNSSESHQLLEEFRRADATYNAGLFTVLDNTDVDAVELQAVIAEMYWPKSQYAYGVLDPEIMAGIYDQYLGERLVFTQDGRVNLEVKPEVIHSGGVVSTPDYIVREIVEATLSGFLSLESYPNQLPRILDPAVGSGAFLIESFRMLVDTLESNGIEPTLERRAHLAKQCLFGIDIDSAAVEVTRLGLLLGVLGNEKIEEAGIRLPSLNENIIAGNAVVRGDFDVLMPDSARNIEVRASVRPLDPYGLTAASKDGMKFDFVLGNPPYVRVQELAKFAIAQLHYFQNSESNYETGQSDATDLYQIFVERALELAKRSGRIGMVIPNRFTNSLPAAPIRRKLTKRLEKIVHFRENQVFPGRSTYVAIIVVGAGQRSEVEIDFVDDLAQWRRNRLVDTRTVTRSELGTQPWPMSTARQAELFKKLESAAIARVGDPGWVDIFVGVQTSADDYYFIQPNDVQSGLAKFTDQSGEESIVETALLRAAIRDQSIEQYDGQPTPDFQIIFPYQKNEKGKYVPIPVETMKNDYPHAWKYFSKFRTRLSPPNRSITPDPGEKVWAYGRSQSLNKLREPKLIVRTLSLEPRYAIDKEGLIAPGGGDGGPYYLLRPAEECPYSIHTIKAILSHPGVDLYVAVNGKKFQGSYASHRKAFLKRVPVPQLSAEDQARIDSATIELAELAERLRTETDDNLRSTIIDRRTFLKIQNEQIITAAFGLTDSEVQAAIGA
ncbi:Eco57I restriction-modification methylase domain-containing protein [Corynebacterium riegelii]|uniref:Eco57I restriction-modification methylase domain-containing protein n=1 Tax=Corynebacterium riegelii TaxID=156976 RepID=UPI0015E0B2CD|nr:Eco57I restriction-modification methylase domain-containing protein [Corynebacterium riegelii]